MKLLLATLLPIATIGFCAFGINSGSPKMKAAVSETIKRGFIIDEKGLRKLNALLNQRFAEKATNYSITYTVKFSNGFYYDTPDLEILLAEENSRSRQM